MYTMQKASVYKFLLIHAIKKLLEAINRKPYTVGVRVDGSTWFLISDTLEIEKHLN